MAPTMPRSSAFPAPRVPTAARGVRRRPSTGEAAVHWYFILFAMLAVLVFRLHELVPFLRFIKPAVIAGPIGVVLLFIRAREVDRQNLFADRWVQLVLALTAWAAMTVPFALVRGAAFATVQQQVLLISVVLAFALIPATITSLDRALTAFALCGGLLAVAALLFGYTVEAGRLAVTGSLDPNDLGLIMVLAATIAAGAAVRVRGLKRMAMAAVVLVCLAVLLKTQSRGATLALGGAACLLALGFSGKRRIGMLFSLTGLLALGWMLAPSSYRERMATLSVLEEDYNNTLYTGRTQIWRRGIGYGLQNPLLGVGPGNFPIAEGDALAELGKPGKWSAAHNAYIQIFAEQGFPGLLLFLSALLLAVGNAAHFSSLRRGKVPTDQLRPELLAVMTAFLIGAFFLSVAYFWALYALWGITSLSKRIIQQASVNRRPIRRS
jgi:O-antigen ligase